MKTTAERIDTHNATLFWTTVIFAIPAALACGCALALRDGADVFFSGLWFVYSTSRVVAMMGVALSIGISAVFVVRHIVTGRGLLIAGLSVAATVFLLWYSAHLATIIG